MSLTFTKLFSSITESTVWCEPDHVRILWITMLAMADRRGRVFGSIPGLANRAIIPVESARDAIARFLAPDRDSRTPDNEGRRIEPIDGGWRLLNHEKYRAIRDEETTKESKRKYINNKRALEREKANKINGVENVDRSRYNAEAEAEAEAGTSKSTTLSGKPDVSTLNGFKSQAKEVLEFLNAKTGRSYKAVPANLEMIAARLKDGATVEELRMVIAKKTREWGGDEKMNQYLRPATLFNRVKYAQYSGELLADPKPLRVAI